MATSNSSLQPVLDTYLSSRMPFLRPGSKDSLAFATNDWNVKYFTNLIYLPRVLFSIPSITLLLLSIKTNCPHRVVIARIASGGVWALCTPHTYPPASAHLLLHRKVRHNGPRLSDAAAGQLTAPEPGRAVEIGVYPSSPMQRNTAAFPAEWPTFKP